MLERIDRKRRKRSNVLFVLIEIKCSIHSNGEEKDESQFLHPLIGLLSFSLSLPFLLSFFLFLSMRKV